MTSQDNFSSRFAKHKDELEWLFMELYHNREGLEVMSRRGNCYDNALAENFFGILKTECIYRRKPETFEEANKMIDDYIYFYNHERIQLKTGLSPLSLRQSG